MTKTGKRFTFKCWNRECEREYSLFREITDQQTLIVACPFCNQEAVVQLEPFRQETKTVIRGITAAEELSVEEPLGYEYYFPDVIPTEKPE